MKGDGKPSRRASASMPPMSCCSSASFRRSWRGRGGTFRWSDSSSAFAARRWGPSTCGCINSGPISRCPHRERDFRLRCRCPTRSGRSCGKAGGRASRRSSWNPDPQIIVTVGYRLSKEMSPEWAAAVVARLEANPRWVWLLVGEGVYPAYLPRAHPRIRAVPHQRKSGWPPATMPPLSQSAAHGRRIQRAPGNGAQDCSRFPRRDRWRRQARIMGGDLGCGVLAVRGSTPGRRRRAPAPWRRAVHAVHDTVYNLRAAVPTLLAALDEGRKHFSQRTQVTP